MWKTCHGRHFLGQQALLTCVSRLTLNHFMSTKNDLSFKVDIKDSALCRQRSILKLKINDLCRPVFPNLFFVRGTLTWYLRYLAAPLAKLIGIKIREK